MKSGWRWVVVACAIAVAALVAGYSCLVPAFEAPDEPGHFRYATMLASGAGLPVQGSAGDFDPELSQPPLYYAVEAGLLRLIPSHGAAVPDFSRHNTYQNTTPAGNLNLYSHPPSEDFPWTGQVLQLHAMRLLNLLFAAATLLATYGVGREMGLSPPLALAGAAMLGVLPQFDFIAGALNADNAITASAALALLLLLRWLHRWPSAIDAAVLGVAIAAAMLAKLSGLAVLPLALAFMLWRAWRDRKPALARQAMLTGGVAVALAGWWYARNLALYGDPLGWQPMLTAVGAMLRTSPLTPLGAAAALLRQAPTAIGVFGWDNVRLPAAVDIAVGVVVALGMAGLFLSRLRERRGEGVAAGRSLSVAGKGPHRASPSAVGEERRVAAGRLLTLESLVLLAWIAVFAISLVRWVQVNTDAAQWRLLFPAFPAIVVLLTLGLSRLWRWLPATAAVGLGGLSAASLALVVVPAYTPGSAYTGPVQHVVDARFGDQLELIGYDDPLLANGHVSLTLYWRALQPIGLADVVHLAALDVGGQPGLQQSTWPEDGRSPTSGWRAGQIVRDRHLLAGAGSLQPGVYRLLLDVFQPLDGAPRLPVAGGTTLEVGRFLVPPPPSASAAPLPAGVFGGSLALLGQRARFGDGRLQVDLSWEVTKPPDRDYTVFVHLLDQDGKVVAQSDSQPDGGRFPTSLLVTGLQVPDSHSLAVQSLPPGGGLEIGVYDAATGQRLKLADGDGDALKMPVPLSP